MTVAMIPPAEIYTWWLPAWRILEALIDKSDGRHDFLSTFDQLKAGKMQLWIVWDGDIKAACVTQLATYPTGRVMLSLPFLSGKGLREFLPQLAASLIRFAIENKASGIELLGRPGWQKVLAPYGFTPADRTLLEVDLSNGQLHSHNADTNKQPSGLDRE